MSYNEKLIINKYKKLKPMISKITKNLKFYQVIIFLIILFSIVFFSTRPPYSKGIFWQVSKDGQIVGHIYGTLHTNDEKITRVNKKVMEIFNNSVGYSIEAFPSSHLWSPYHGFEDIKKKMMYEDKTLADVVGNKTANEVYKILTKNGVTEEYAKKIKPWAAMFSLGSKSKHTGPILDNKLLDLAAIQNKEIYQIETPEELLAAFYQMPIDSQTELLKLKIKNYPNNDQVLKKMIDAYLEEDLVGLINESTSFVDKSNLEQNKHLQVYLKHSLYDRNIVMAHYMLMPFLYGLDRYKGQGGTFVSVGAIHLVGEKGVLSLLEKQYGFEIKRIKLM